MAHLVIDATGLKVYGEGERKVRKHGKETRRVWRKLHLAVDVQTHAILKKKGTRATIPPRKNAAQWEEGYPRNEAVKALKAGELKEWKRSSGYHQRSKAETAMYRFKQLISSKLSLRNYNAQVGEVLAGVKAMKK